MGPLFDTSSWEGNNKTIHFTSRAQTFFGNLARCHLWHWDFLSNIFYPKGHFTFLISYRYVVPGVDLPESNFLLTPRTFWLVCIWPFPSQNCFPELPGAVDCLLPWGSSRNSGSCTVAVLHSLASPLAQFRYYVSFQDAALVIPDPSSARTAVSLNAHKCFWSCGIVVRGGLSISFLPMSSAPTSGCCSVSTHPMWGVG